MQNYSTTGTLRTEFPTIETSVGTMAYWRNLRFGEHGWTFLGGFEKPYTGAPGSTPFTINGIDYEGEIRVFLRRDKDYALEFSSVHRVGNWRADLTGAAMHRLEKEFLPIAQELFPLPTREEIAHYVHQEADREIYSAVTSAIHSLSMRVYHDARFSGYAEEIKEGLKAGLERVKPNIDSERFNTVSY